MTVTEAIKRALRLIGAIDPNVTPESFQLADGLTALNLFLASLSAQKNAIYAPTTKTFNTVSGTASYTIGSGGDIDVTRPKNIIKAFIQESDNTDYQIEIIALDNYFDIVDKTIESRPKQLYHEKTYATGTIYLYYTPDAVYTITLKLWAAFPIYTTLTESLALPLEYEEMICSNLAIRLAPEYQRPISQELALMARDSMKTVKGLNSQPVPQIASDPFRAPTKTNIYDG